MIARHTTKMLTDFAWALWLLAGIALGAWLATGAW
jgi:hypothetical protein